MPPSTLTLVGVVHRSGGHRRLLDLLITLRPGAITLEMSPYALAFRLRRGPLLLARLETIVDLLAAETGRPRAKLGSHPQVESIRTLLALPFEYTATAEYAAETGIPLELIDSSLISARKLRRAERELVTTENLRILLDLPPADTTENLQLARKLVHGTADSAIRRAFLAPRRGPEGIGERDRHMAAVIRQRADGVDMVHIGGWVHLVEDERGETLFSRLRDLGPRRVLLE